MQNFFSALEIVFRRAFSSFSVRVEVLIKERPHGLGEVGEEHADAVERNDPVGEARALLADE